MQHAMDVEAALKVAVARLGVAELRDQISNLKNKQLSPVLMTSAVGES